MSRLRRHWGQNTLFYYEISRHQKSGCLCRQGLHYCQQSSKYTYNFKLGKRWKCKELSVGGEGSGKVFSRRLNLPGTLKRKHHCKVPGMALSLGYKGHSADAPWVVYEDVPQGLGKSRFILKEDIFVSLCACWVKMTSAELFLAVSFGGAAHRVWWPKHVRLGVELIFPKYPFYLLVPQFRSLQWLPKVHSQIPWSVTPETNIIWPWSIFHITSILSHHSYN